ncbi:MAG: GGDEF domain-containing protein [Firmicutes bacterium]|nr:GGDEF domain-containing protein [Bacillota bacterium]
MEEIGIDEILNKLDIFEKSYEIIRIVDPVMKKVLTNNKNPVPKLDFNCFDFWGNSKVCDNCISIRSYNDNKTYVKFEYTENSIFLVTAIPYEFNGRRVVIELLKDATDSLVLNINEDGLGEKSEIYELINNMNKGATRDPLTGLYNRRYINEKLPLDIINMLLSDHNLSVIMADIDFFKNVNDTYGHLAGDDVLKIFAQTLLGSISRSSDWIARYGGEEFLICLPGANQAVAIKIIEGMRKAVEDKEMIFGENKLKITASFGICSLKPTNLDSMESMIKMADEKLYLAKENGRNRIEY